MDINLDFNPLLGFTKSHFVPYNEDETHILIVDTETIGLAPDNLIYDIGYVIVNQKGEPVHQNCFIVEEVFTDAKRMKQAYYANKIFDCYPKILTKYKIVPWKTILKTIMSLLKEYRIQSVIAYNESFDRQAINQTSKVLGIRNVFQEKLNQQEIYFYCLLKTCCHSFMQTKSYKSFCKTHGLITQKNNIQTKAEAAMCYLTGDVSFVEDHTALSDAVIESMIFKFIIENYEHPRNYSHNKGTWQAVNVVKENVSENQLSLFKDKGFSINTIKEKPEIEIKEST